MLNAINDPRLFAPATLRNRDAIAEVLEQILPAHCRVLEIASGTGEHACYFAQRYPAWQWHPSEADARLLDSIRAWSLHTPSANLHAPVSLDVCHHPWPIAQVDAVVAVNLLHISPADTTLHLMRGAAATLRPGGKLLVYGPFFVDGVATAASNLAFDASLQEQDPQWGIRAWETVDAAAKEFGLSHQRTFTMPADNFCSIWQRAPAT